MLKVGSGFVFLTYLTRSPEVIWIFVAGSALSFSLMAASVFLIPKKEWSTGLLRAFLVIFLYLVSMPYWGRKWYAEETGDGWRIFLLYIVMALNIILPAIHGFERKSGNAKSLLSHWAHRVAELSARAYLVNQLSG